MTTNVLVAKNYKVESHAQWYTDRTQESNLPVNYSSME
jgi:hypothetical protein